jgi:hypothetical protein
MRKIDCPIEGQEECWIGLPDEWLGRHILRRDQALAKIRESKQESELFIRFSISMALMEDWKLPGLGGNPEQWDLEQVNLTVMLWVSEAVLSDFGTALLVPKARSAPSQTG